LAAPKAKRENEEFTVVSPDKVNTKLNFEDSLRSQEKLTNGQSQTPVFSQISPTHEVRGDVNNFNITRVNPHAPI